ncbi:hypothetical protein NFI96_000597 [Prochilodus magdalenae]|nr:hypothetical protein NFI96_000597 [Prochilodus magdalenae]
MSWAAEDWTAGLSGRVLQKIRELQAHNEKLSRERQQRQLQLDNSEAALHKQKQKVFDEVRVELAAVHRELVGVREGAQAEVQTKERLVQELQGKASQVCALENQLESSKAQTQKLTQEVKRLEAELEKLQKESVSGESMLFSTPCWNMNSPWDQNDVMPCCGRSGLRGGGEIKAHHVRQHLMFGDSPKSSLGGASSQFPQQPHKTPSLRRGVLQSEGRAHASVFPWERNDTSPTPGGKLASYPSLSSSSSDVIATGPESRDNGTEEVLRKERDVLRFYVFLLNSLLQQLYPLNSPLQQLFPLNSPLQQLFPLNSPLQQLFPLNSPLQQLFPLNSPLQQLFPLNSPLQQLFPLNSPLQQLFPLNSPLLQRFLLNSPLQQLFPLNSPLQQLYLLNSPLQQLFPLNSPLLQRFLLNSPLQQLFLPDGASLFSSAFIRFYLCERVSWLQKELQVEKERCKETSSRLTQTQKELNTKEQNLVRTKDELTRAQTCITQDKDRAQAAEQRVKQLQEELKCQRQNAETSRCSAEQRRKDMERDHQKELLELQRERQSEEKQHQQESNRLNQEIQQARTAHNTLQAQCDKGCRLSLMKGSLALQKQGVERDLEGVQAKLKSTQADLTESQRRETQTLTKLTESLREGETLRISLEQLKKREKSLEEEVKRLTEELAEALKLIKELQAQLAAPPPLVSHSFNPCTEDNFTPVLSNRHDRSAPHQVLVQKKRALKPEMPRPIERPGMLTYPPDREPGEGIESDHVSEFGSGNSVTLSIKEHEGNQYRAGIPGEVDMDSSITEQDTGIEDTDTDSCLSDSTSDRMFKDEGFPQIHNFGTKNPSSSLQGQEQDSSSISKLKKENTVLRDELRDTKQELERRLDDLETQRRAETEARTKLKQLSKKHSSQAEQHRVKAQELKEKGSKLEAQLEQERKESARLQDLLATLEKEAKKRQEEGEREDDKSREENFKLKKTLAEMGRKEEQLKGEMENLQKKLEKLQSEVLQEREERAREREEEKSRFKNKELEGLKIAELQAELDRLQRSAGMEGENVKDNMPFTYLQLGNQSNATDDITANTENDIVSSPDAVSFCESVNLQNTMFSTETRIAPLITECGTQTKSAEHSQQNTEDSANLEGQEKHREGTDLDNTTILVLEVERLRVQRDREAERATKFQKKLEVLQNQVTNQTQQLTLAFEKQSKHIQDLLVEVQERDVALQRQAEELQRSQEVVASLKADKHLGESNTEQSAEHIVESSFDSFTSNATADTQEIVKEKPSVTLKDKPQQPDLPSFTKVEVRNEQHDSKRAELDNSQISVVAMKTEEPVSLPSSDEHGRDSACHTENKTSGPLESANTVQQGRAMENNSEIAESSSSSSSKPSEPSDISEFPQSHMEYPTDDVMDLKRVINELHEAQIELSLLKAKHDELTLQLQEMSKENYLLLKQENEQLKFKLKAIDIQTCESQNPLLTQNKASHLTNTKEVNPAVVIQGEHYAYSSSKLEEAVGAVESFDDDNREKSEEKYGESKDETAQVHSLQEQVHALQTQFQLLSKQNREQAEELKLWRLSASSPGEIMDDHGSDSPIVLVREDQLVLSCSPTDLHLYKQQSRSIREHGDCSQREGRSGFETVHDERDKQLLSQKTTANVQSVLKAKESVADDDGTTIKADDQQKMEITAMSLNSTFIVSSEIENSGNMHDSAHPVRLEGLREDASEAALLTFEKQLRESTFTTKVKEDCSAIAKSETKAIDPKLNAGSLARSDPLKPHLNINEVTLAQHLGILGSMTDQHSEHTAPVGRQTDNSGQREDDVEASKVTSSVVYAGTKEVKSASTQTAECSEREVEQIGKSIAPQERASLVHASTQTYAEEVKQPKEDDKPVHTSSSTVLPSETEKRMFSGAFPIPANPAHLAERIRRNRSRMSAAYDDTEYEPYGLPEVVMKGFADIPTGPACPYVLRRGLLGTDALPVSLREPLKEAEEDVDP